MLWCFYWTKLQKLKAIHNKPCVVVFKQLGAFTEQNYKNWKQFTTTSPTSTMQRWVLLLNKITKIESNSQRGNIAFNYYKGCFYWTKLQKLKAIHNCCDRIPKKAYGAFTEQNYKNWKQFTTCVCFDEPRHGCFYWTKLQKLKAIHNSYP